MGRRMTDKVGAFYQQLSWQPLIIDEDEQKIFIGQLISVAVATVDSSDSAS